jgi:hypothetical protein
MSSYEEHAGEAFTPEILLLLEDEVVRLSLKKPGRSAGWVHIAGRRRLARPRSVLRVATGRLSPSQRHGSCRKFVEQLYRYEE